MVRRVIMNQNNYLECRETICRYAELYLDTCHDDFININDGMMQPQGIGANKFLILLALLYPREEKKTIYSIDINLTEDNIREFVDKEYCKINQNLKKKDPIEIGEIILNDAQCFYENKYGQSDNNSINSVMENLPKDLTNYF